MVARNLKIIGLLVSTYLYKSIFVWLLTYKDLSGLDKFFYESLVPDQ